METCDECGNPIPDTARSVINPHHTCDECGNPIPDTARSNPHHKESCSAHGPDEAADAPLTPARLRAIAGVIWQRCPEPPSTESADDKTLVVLRGFAAELEKGAAAMELPRIIIAIEGGLVSCMTGIPPGLVVEVRDYDTEGADADEITNIDGEDCFVREHRFRK